MLSTCQGGAGDRMYSWRMTTDWLSSVPVRGERQSAHKFDSCSFAAAHVFDIWDRNVKTLVVGFPGTKLIVVIAAF